MKIQFQTHLVAPSCFGRTVGCKWRIDHYFPILLSWTESSPELVGLFGLPCTVSWLCDRPLKSSLHLDFFLLQSNCGKDQALLPVSPASNPLLAPLIGNDHSGRSFLLPLPPFHFTSNLLFISSSNSQGFSKDINLPLLCNRPESWGDLRLCGDLSEVVVVCGVAPELWAGGVAEVCRAFRFQQPLVWTAERRFRDDIPKKCCCSFGTFS